VGSQFPKLYLKPLIDDGEYTDLQMYFKDHIAVLARRASSASREALSKLWRYLRRYWICVRSRKKTANHRSRDGIGIRNNGRHCHRTALLSVRSGGLVLTK
jgi:hypothetical protein